MTVYAGDQDNKKLIVIPKGSNSPIYIDMKFKPFRGALIKRDTVLLVGCLDSSLLYFSLATPTDPRLEKSLNLRVCISSLVMMSDDLLLCG
jgi:hypothetical protein